MLLKGILIFVHIVVCIILVLVVLLQTGKRADLAGAFGGGGSQTAFGARGAATVLSKMTTAGAIIFMLTSLTLAVISTTNRGSAPSALEDLPEAPAATQTAPLPAPDGSLPAPVSDTEGQPDTPASETPQQD